MAALALRWILAVALVSLVPAGMFLVFPDGTSDDTAISTSLLLLAASVAVGGAIVAHWTAPLVVPLPLWFPPVAIALVTGRDWAEELGELNFYVAVLMGPIAGGGALIGWALARWRQSARTQLPPRTDLP